MNQKPKTKRVGVTGITVADMRADAYANPGRLHCKTLATMSEREIRALEKHYGCPVIRPD